nr:hypothetical protein GCM10020063_087180 [Dactylosporangium thailandense]
MLGQHRGGIVVVGQVATQLQVQAGAAQTERDEAVGGVEPHEVGHGREELGGSAQTQSGSHADEPGPLRAGPEARTVACG